jgi:Dolichyl-phosphate-mannose-protein mannosyltransferase
MLASEPSGRFTQGEQLRKYIGALFLLWTGIIIAAYYVVQKPGLLSAFTGLIDTLWTLLAAVILVFNAYGLGKRTLHLFKFESHDSSEHLLLSCGIGLGTLGLLGLFFSAIQLAREEILTIIQFSLAAFFLVKNDFHGLRADLKSLTSDLNLSFSQYNLFTKLVLFSLLTFSFLLTLVPPFEAFDALFYHLTQPARILQDGGLRAIQVAPHFWFPNLTENVFLWALGMGSERATQIMHFTWAVLSALLLWHWAAKTWNAEIARKTVLILASMPALPMLAAWAYADMALVYYSVAAMYALAQYRITKLNHWLAVIALASGFAMSVKYTSFVVPLAAGLLLLFHRPFRRSAANAAQFSAIAVLTALPYYARNAVLMHNPFYPFVFGGRYWDDFRAAWYADSGSGIGWNALELFLLPFNTLLGHHDANFFDGRMGPLFLILAPFTIWILISRTPRDQAESGSLLSIGVFSLLSLAAWTVGVINSSALWQGRLLFPALIPFAIPTALAWDSLKAFDTSKLRISFLVNTVIAVVLALTVLDTAIFVLQRNPLAVALGAQTRQRYIERVNPSYAALMSLMNELPPDANVYSLFEPRTYGLPRPTQPDAIIYNFADDVYRYETADAIIEHWKSEQYTHVIVYERGLDFMVEFGSSKFTPSTQAILQEILGRLSLVAQTPDQVYSIYQIP